MSEMMIEQNDGRRMYPSSYRQFHIYSGILEGVPNTRITQRTLEHLEKDLGERGSDYYILPCTPRTYMREPGDLDRLLADGIDVAILPLVCTIARFNSTGLEGSSSDMSSGLTLVWFQDDFGSPPENIIEQLRHVPWSERAIEWDIMDFWPSAPSVFAAG